MPYNKLRILFCPTLTRNFGGRVEQSNLKCTKAGVSNPLPPLPLMSPFKRARLNNPILTTTYLIISSFNPPNVFVSFII